MSMNTLSWPEVEARSLLRCAKVAEGGERGDKLSFEVDMV